MNRTVSFIPGEVYHLYNRGIDKQLIFRTAADYQRFQRLLYIRNSNKIIDMDRVKHKSLSEIDRGDPLVNIATYTLMPNHFHILIAEIEKGGISKFMQRLGTSYTMYINKKYERTGSLMCRPFRSSWIDSDEYLRWIFSYIHLNPQEIIKRGDYDSFKDYPYSSYHDYYDTVRDEGLILHTGQAADLIDGLESEHSMKTVLTERDTDLLF
jgi:putative transposase